LRRRSSSDSWLIRSLASSVSAPARLKPVLRAAVFIGILLIIIGPCFAAPETLTVASVRVVGNLRTESAAIVNTLGLEPGSTYPYNEVRAALERVFRMGFFDDIRLYTAAAAAGTDLTVEVVERPVVVTIKISGNKKIGKDDVRAKVALAAGSSLDGRLVDESIRAIQALYKDKGYYLANVSPETTFTSPAAVSLTFKVEEGVKMKVGEISVDGNTVLSDRAIRKVMETKEKGWFARKDFNPDKYDGDTTKIVRLYKDKGYISAKVVEHRVEMDEARGRADLSIVVDEGPKVYVRSLEVDVAPGEDSEAAVSRDALTRSIMLRAGEPYNLSAFEKSVEQMYSVLGDQGFVYAEIDPVESLEGDSLGLVFKVNPQRAVHVVKVLIEGNETTFEKVIRRELMIKPGDTLRRSLVERSHRDIFNLGYFDNVEVGSQVANAGGDIDLVFKVTERTTGIANIGAGYSEEFGITGFIEFSHDNMGWFRKFPYLGLGKGQSLNLRWEFGKLTQIELGYRNPWFRDTPTLVGLDIYDTRREYETYTDKRGGFGLVAGKRLPLIDYSKVYLRYSLERRELAPDEAKASSYVKSQAGSRTTSSVTMTVTRNSVDNPFFPRAGSRTTGSAEWAGAWLGGSTAYQSYVLDNSNFLAVPVLNSALVLKVRVGVLDALGSKGYIPVYERFRLGGTTLESVRGYDDREIVPEGNASDEGGRFMMTGTLEYRVPIIKNQAFARGFFDAGDTWNSVRGARPGFLKSSAGLGFMIEIPMVGQIGLDIGYGFDRGKLFGGPGWKTHFQFGMSGL